MTVAMKPGPRLALPPFFRIGRNLSRQSFMRSAP
jgi:hypothetical protein